MKMSKIAIAPNTRRPFNGSGVLKVVAESGPGLPVRNSSLGRRKTEKFSEITANLQ